MDSQLRLDVGDLKLGGRRFAPADSLAAFAAPRRWSDVPFSSVLVLWIVRLPPLPACLLFVVPPRALWARGEASPGVVIGRVLCCIAVCGFQ